MKLILTVKMCIRDSRNTLRNQCSVRNYSGNPVWNVVQYPYMPQKPKRNERSGFEMAKKGFIAEFKEFIARGNVMDLAVGVITVSYTHLRTWHLYDL